MNKPSLNSIRKKIDRLDNKIVQDIADRMELAKAVGVMKKNLDLAITQKGREKEVWENYQKLAEENGLDEGFLLKVIRLILKESKRLQKQ